MTALVELVTTKRCSACKEVKSFFDFHSNKSRRDGLFHYCRSCTKIKNAKWRSENKERIPGIWRKSAYGLDEETFAQMLLEQKGRCYLCKKEMKVPCVDHDHETGKVRRLLCSSCNSALGVFQDSPEMLEAAAAYIRQFKEKD